MDDVEFLAIERERETERFRKLCEPATPKEKAESDRITIKYSFCSSFYNLFKMANVKSFVKTKLSQFILEEKIDEKHGFCVYEINMNAVKEFCSTGVTGQSLYELLTENENFNHERFELIVMSDDFAALVSTHYSYTSAVYADDEKMPNGSGKELEYIYSFCSAYTQSVGYTFYEDSDRKNYEDDRLNETPHGALKKCYMSKLSMLFDIIVNHSLDDKEYQSVTFVIPDDCSVSTMECRKGDYTIDSFSLRKTSIGFKFLFFSAKYIHSMEDENRIADAVRNYVSHDFGGQISEEALCSFGDGGYTCSLPCGQSIALFREKQRPVTGGLSEAGYESYKMSYLHAIFSKTDCILDGDGYILGLRANNKEQVATEEETEDLLRKLKLLKNDTRQNVSAITDGGIESLWLQKTNTLDLVDNLEMICTYLEEREKVKREKKLQKILSILNIISALTIASVFGDLWNIWEKNSPVGKICTVVIMAFFIAFTCLFMNSIYAKQKK